MYKIEAVVAGTFFPDLKETLFGLSRKPDEPEILTTTVSVDDINCGLHKTRRSEHAQTWHYGFDKIEFCVDDVEVRGFLDELARHEGKVADITATPLHNFIDLDSAK